MTLSATIEAMKKSLVNVENEESLNLEIQRLPKSFKQERELDIIADNLTNIYISLGSAKWPRMMANRGNIMQKKTYVSGWK